MIRLLALLALASVGCRLVFGKWPWEMLAVPSRSNPEQDKARALLGVKPGASREEILEAHKRLIAIVHPDRGGTSEQVHEANQARDALLTLLVAREPR